MTCGQRSTERRTLLGCAVLSRAPAVERANCCCCAHLEALHHSLDHFVLQAAVLALCVLPDGDQVNVIVLGLVPGQAEARPHVGIQVELLHTRSTGAHAALRQTGR